MILFKKEMIKGLENGDFVIKNFANCNTEEERQYFQDVFFDLSDIVAEKYPNFYVNTTTLTIPCCLLIEGNNESYYILAMDDKDSINRHIHIFGCPSRKWKHLTLKELFFESTDRDFWDFSLLKSLWEFTKKK